MNNGFIYDPFMELRGRYITDGNPLLDTDGRNSLWSALKRFFLKK